MQHLQAHLAADRRRCRPRGSAGPGHDRPQGGRAWRLARGSGRCWPRCSGSLRPCRCGTWPTTSRCRWRGLHLRARAAVPVRARAAVRAHPDRRRYRPGGARSTSTSSPGSRAATPAAIERTAGMAAEGSTIREIASASGMVAARIEMVVRALEDIPRRAGTRRTRQFRLLLRTRSRRMRCSPPCRPSSSCGTARRGIADHHFLGGALRYSPSLILGRAATGAAAPPGQHAGGWPRLADLRHGLGIGAVSRCSAMLEIGAHGFRRIGTALITAACSTPAPW